MSSPNAAFASRRGRLERLVELARLADDAHAAPAAARGRLDEQREAELVRLAGRDDGHAGLGGDPLRLELVAARAAAPPADGPTQMSPAALDRLGEVGVLGEEAVAGMDRVGAGLLRRADVLLASEVARDLDRLVGGAGVQRAAVVRRGDRDGRDPELAAGAEDAHRDLAAVRHEELADRHRCGS